MILKHILKGQNVYCSDTTVYYVFMYEYATRDNNFGFVFSRRKSRGQMVSSLAKKLVVDRYCQELPSSMDSWFSRQLLEKAPGNFRHSTGL